MLWEERDHPEASLAALLPNDKLGVAVQDMVAAFNDGTFEKSKAVLKVAFTPSKSGPVSVGGKFSLSVCSDKNCLMDKKDLALDVTVK